MAPRSRAVQAKPSATPPEALPLQTSQDVHVPWMHVLVVGLVAAATYSNIINHSFVYDDESTVEYNPLVLPQQGIGVLPLSALLTHDFWGTPMASDDSHKSFRPFTTLTYRMQAAIHGYNPLPFHVFDLCVHALASAAFVVVAAIILQDNRLALIAGLLFATHPIHTEAVANITGRAETLCALFYFTAFYCHVKSVICSSRQWLFLALACFALASLSKEHGITFGGMAIMYDIVVATEMLPGMIRAVLGATRAPQASRPEGGSVVTRAALYSAVAGILVGARTSVSGKNLYPWIPFMDNAGTRLSCDDIIQTIHTHIAGCVKDPVARVLSYMYIHARDLHLLVWPAVLKADYSMPTVPLVTDMVSIEAVLAISVVPMKGLPDPVYYRLQLAEQAVF